MRFSASRLLATMMAVMLVVSSTAWAAGAVFVGSLHSTGVVLTNAVHMPDGGTVRSGDSISTQPGALAVISSPTYGRLEVRANSEARLNGNRVQLERGAVAASRLPVQVGSYTISPQNPTSTWFAVANRDGRLLVAAHKGNVIIASAGAPPVVVEEGSLAQQPKQEEASTTPQAAPDQPQTDQPATNQQTGKKKKRAAAGAAAGAWTIGGLSHAASIALVVGVGAAVAGTAAGAAVAISDSSPSPSR